MNILILIIVCVSFVCFCYYISCKDDFKVYSKGYFMSENRELDTLQKLYSLRDFVKSLEMIDLTKNSILKRVEFEIELMERQAFIELGREKFNEMINK